VVGPYTDCCCCGCIPVKSSTVTLHHCNTHTRQGHRLAKPHTSCQVLAVVIVVNSLTITHYQCTDIGYSFGASFCYGLIRESLMLPHFWRWEWGSAYTRVYMVVQHIHAASMTNIFNKVVHDTLMPVTRCLTLLYDTAII